MKTKRGLILAIVSLILLVSVAGFSCKPERAPAPPAPAPTPPESVLPPTPTPAPAPTIPLVYYQNTIFGFRLGYPSDWQAVETGDFSPVVVMTPTEENLPTLIVSVTYGAEVLAPDKMADTLIADVLTLPGAKVVSENEVTLEGEPPAYEMIYSIGRGEQEMEGVLLVATRGSQALVVSLLSPSTLFEEKGQDFLYCLHSLQLEEPSPFGISRQESLTLFFPEPLTLDPAQATESLSVQYITQIFSGLVAFTPTLELVPDLAENYEVSADGKEYTFYLRSNARFHNGKQVTAEDIKYSWERAALTGSPTALTYLGDIIGVKEVIEGKATTIRGVEVIDDRTLRVTIDAAKVYFLARLTHPVAFVVDRDNVGQGGEQWWLNPNGTGPFLIKGWQQGIVMALERNSDYYRTPAKIPYIVFRHLGLSSLRMYETGEIDVAFPGITELEEITQPGNPLTEELTEVAQLGISFIGFDTTEPPFDDVAVRRSFLLAADRERLIREVFKDRVEIAHGFLPPGLPAYNPGLTPISFDPEEARRLLAESSYGQNLPPITFVAAGYTAPPPEVEALISMWQENLGVRVEIKMIAPEDYYYKLKTEMENLYHYAWIADYPDPENFLDLLFHSQATNNVGKYTNTKVDQLLEKARVESNPQARYQLYQEVEEILRQDVAAIPLSFDRGYVLIKPFVKGFVISPQGLFDLHLVSFTPT